MLLFSGISVFSAEKTKTDTLLASFQKQYTAYMRNGDLEEVYSYAKSFYDRTASSADDGFRLFVLSYMGQAGLATDRYDSAYSCLLEAYSIWKNIDSIDRTENDRIAAITMFNSIGVYHVSMDMDYRKAIEFFLDGMRLSGSNSRYHYNYDVLGLNLVVTYNLRRDTSGLSYAKNIYEYGKSSGESYFVYAGAYCCALMYFLKGDVPNAEKYMDEVMSNIGNFANVSDTYCLYAQILEKKGEFAEADIFYRQALELVEKESTVNRLSVYLAYGVFLNATCRYAEAISLLEKGIELSESTGVRVFRHEFYEELSNSYEQIGDLDKALIFYKKYNLEYTDVYSIEKEREINEVMRKYENEQHQLELMKKSRVIQAVLFISALILLVSVVVYMLYRRENRLYTSIVRQYRDSIKKEKKLEEKIQELEVCMRRNETSAECERYAKSSLEERRKTELFDALESLMKKQGVYRESNLTVDKVAKMLDSNRTYLSQIINEKTGMTFLNYINSYRIDESISILSDTENNIPLKALCTDLGFKSTTTFYKLFQERVGMTPAKYREKFLLLSRTDKGRSA